MAYVPDSLSVSFHCLFAVYLFVVLIYCDRPHRTCMLIYSADTFSRYITLFIVLLPVLTLAIMVLDIYNILS
jgi:hypothetical protein